MTTTDLTERIEKMSHEEHVARCVSLLDEQVRLGNLDVRLCRVLKVLNGRGYYTYSCSRAGRREDRGFIAFTHPSYQTKAEYELFCQRVLYLLSLHKLRDIRFSEFDRFNRHGRKVVATFTSIKDGK